MAEDAAGDAEPPVELMPPENRINLDQPPEELPPPIQAIAEPDSEDYDSFWSPDTAPRIASSGKAFYRGKAYIQIDAVMMSREGPTKPLILAQDLSSPAENELHTNPYLGYSAMARLTYGRILGRDKKNRDHSVEFTFLGFGNWNSAGSLTSYATGNGLITRQDPTHSIPGFNGSHIQSYDYKSAFNSYELNYRVRQRLGRDRLELASDGTWVRKVTPMPTPSFFGGLRVVTLNEHFNYDSLGIVASQIYGHYDIQTTNFLIGPQAGLDVMYQHARWRVGARAKAGPYVNTSTQRSQVVAYDAFLTSQVPNRNESARSTQFSFIYDVNFSAAYQLRQNVALRVGFDLIAINELALGPNQVRFPAQATPAVDNTGFVLMMGGETGLEVVW